MKKLLLVLAIGTFAACNDGGGADEPAADSTTVNEAPAPAPVDSTATATDSTATTPAADSSTTN